MIQNRLRSGRWERLHAGVYRVAGAPLCWHQSLMAACLGCGSEAASSHRSGAALWELPSFAQGPIELSIPRNERRRRGFLVHRTLLPRVDVTVVRGVPVTTAARTLIDIASIETPDVVEAALDDALRRKLVSAARLRWRLAELGRRGWPGIGLIRSLVEARRPGDPIPQSVFETRLLGLLTEGGLPRPVLQHEVRVGRKLAAVLDFAFPSLRLGIEADGYRWHSGRARWEHDLARRNALTSLGWRLVHVTWNDVTRRAPETIDAIRDALAQGNGHS